MADYLTTRFVCVISHVELSANRSQRQKKRNSRIVYFAMSVEAWILHAILMDIYG